MTFYKQTMSLVKRYLLGVYIKASSLYFDSILKSRSPYRHGLKHGVLLCMERSYTWSVLIHGVFLYIEWYNTWSVLIHGVFIYMKCSYTWSDLIH